MSGSTRSSCCMSASMTAITLPVLASMPAITAELRPWSLKRRNTRTLGWVAAYSSATSQVRSGESSSTTRISWLRSTSAASSLSSRGTTLSTSLKVGVITDNWGARRRSPNRRLPAVEWGSVTIRRT